MARETHYGNSQMVNQRKYNAATKRDQARRELGAEHDANNSHQWQDWRVPGRDISEPDTHGRDCLTCSRTQVKTKTGEYM
jgi:hypothetical protein